MKFATLVSSLVASLGFFSIIIDAHAGPYRVRAHYDESRFHSEAKRIRSGGSSRENIKPISFNARVAGLGSIRVSFGKRVHKDWAANFRNVSGDRVDSLDPVLLQGSISIGHVNFGASRGAQPTAGAIIDGKLRINFERTSRNGRTRYYTVTVPLSGKNRKVKVASVPQSFADAKVCGLKEAQSHKGSNARGAARSSELVSIKTTTRMIEIATDFDERWYSRFQENSNAEIAARINAADVIYQRDLGTTLSIVAQTGYQSSSPYTSSDASTLLTQFRTNAARFALRDTSDALILFSGFDFAGSTIGIAYVGTLCEFQGQYSYGTIQYFSGTLDPLIFAHELGHIVNMNHTTNGDIMNASLNGSTYFSATSISAGIAQMDQYPECIALSGNPTPTPTVAPTNTSTPSPTASPTATSTPVGDDPAPPPPPTVDPGPDASPILVITKQRVKSFTEGTGRRDTRFVRRITLKGLLFDEASLEDYDGVTVSLVVNGQPANVSATTSNGAWSMRFRVVGRGRLRIQAQATVGSETVDSNIKSVRRLSR